MVRTSHRQITIQRVRRLLRGGNDSEDELATEDPSWDWIYRDEDPQTPSRTRRRGIIGARLDKIKIYLGDIVLLKADENDVNKTWLCIIRRLFDGTDDHGEDEKMADIMWFCAPSEVPKMNGREHPAYTESEVYITSHRDVNPLTTINGHAQVVSEETFLKQYPDGKVPRNSPDYGKLFLCRRGANTRTTRFTETFRWEDVYHSDNISKLENLIDEQTKGTQKQERPRKKATYDDDFVVDGDDDDDDDDDDDFFVDGDDDDDDYTDRKIPSTPKRKPRIRSSVTPTGKILTPRQPKSSGRRRMQVKEKLTFTPLGTRQFNPDAFESQYQVARSQLHPSSVPELITCREKEYENIWSRLRAALTIDNDKGRGKDSSQGGGACLYICGTPGTGKTTTVRNVVSHLKQCVAYEEEISDFHYLEINGMQVTSANESYAILWEALHDERISSDNARSKLDYEFSKPSPSRMPCVVLMDELDKLVTKNQDVMYNFFNWTTLRHSRLIVLAVANTLDMPQRILPERIQSRMGKHLVMYISIALIAADEMLGPEIGNNPINFEGYTYTQLESIINTRLGSVRRDIMDPTAISFACRSVASVTGDARRVLDILRRALEIAETENQSAHEPGTPSKTAARPGIVTMSTIKKVIREASDSVVHVALRDLPLPAKVILRALMACVRETKLQTVPLGDVLDLAGHLARQSTSGPIRSLVSSDPLRELSQGGRSVARQPSLDLPLRLREANAAIQMLNAARFVRIDDLKGDRVGKITPLIDSDAVQMAMMSDDVDWRA